MKKLYSLLLVITMLTISGCGGGGDANGNGPEPKSTLTFKSISTDTNGTHAEITIDVTSQQDNDIVVRLEDFDVTADYTTRALKNLQIYNLEATPSILEFKRSGTKKLVISFDYAPADSNIENISISYTKILKSKYSDSTILKKETNTVTSLVPSEEEGASNEMIEMVVQAEKTVLSPNESTNIIVQVNDLNVTPKKPAAEHSVSIIPIDPSDGMVDSYSKTANINGQLIFSYTAPASINEDKTVTLTVYSDTYRDVKIDVELSLKRVTTGQYRINATNEVVVKEPGKTYEIRVSLYRIMDGGNTTPAIGKKVVANVLPLQYGTLSSYEAEVGSSGIAVFTYEAPTRFTDINTTDITFYFEEDRSIHDNTSLTFSQDIANVANLYVLPDHITITESGQNVPITLVTVNEDNIGVSSQIVLENPALEGVDYGTFDKSIVTTDTNGRATVNYTSPSNITDLEERNITITETEQSIKKTLTLQFRESIDMNGTNYDIKAETPGSLSVDGSGTLTLTIHQLGKEEVLIPNSQVLEVNVTSKFPNMLTFENNDTSITYQELATSNIRVYTKRLSGIAVLEVSALINDGTKNVRLQKEIPVTILSGPVTSVSLFYNGTTTDPNNGLHINKYTLHAVDKYANPARPGLKVSPTLINGTKLIVSPTRSSGTGIVEPGVPARFKDNSRNFDSVTTEDRLVVVPNQNRFDPTYLGGWTISNVDTDTLNLDETYDGVTTDGLNYIIGNETRMMIDNNPATAHIKDASGEYVTNENGTVELEVSFDPVLSGHTVALGAYVSDEKRMGISMIAQLRWGEFTSSTENIENDGLQHDVYLQLGIGGNSPQHLMDVDINPKSILATPVKACDLNTTNSSLHTDKNGVIRVSVDTNGNTSDAETCTITWNKENSSIFLEY
ncbi:hypothetical protein [Hydrogenimonas sp.]